MAKKMFSIKLSQGYLNGRYNIFSCQLDVYMLVWSHILTNVAGARKNNRARIVALRAFSSHFVRTFRRTFFWHWRTTKVAYKLFRYVHILL